MEFRRKIVVLLGIILVLAVSYTLGTIFSPENVHKRRSNIPLYANLKTDKVIKIEVGTKDGKIDIVKNGKAWSVLIDGKPYPANPNKVDSILKEIKKLKQGKVISKNPDNWKDFDVTKDKAKTIAFYDSKNKKLVRLLVGKSGLGGSGYYVRRDDDNTVFQIERDISYYLNIKDDFWSYLKIFPQDIKKDKVIKVVVNKRGAFDDKDKYAELKYTLYKNESKEGASWKIREAENKKIDEDEVDILLGDIIRLEGVRFVTGKNPKDVGLVKSDTFLEITTENNKSYRIIVGKKNPKEEQFYVKLKDGEYIYLVSVWQLKRIFKGMDELYKKEEKKKDSKK